MLQPIPENLIALHGGKLEKNNHNHNNNKKTETDNLRIKSDFNLIQAPFGPIYFIKCFMQDNSIAVHLTVLKLLIN